MCWTRHGQRVQRTGQRSRTVSAPATPILGSRPPRLFGLRVHVLRHAAGAFTAPQMIELTRLSKDAVYQACKRGADMGVLEIVGTTVDGNITYRRTM